MVAKSQGGTLYRMEDLRKASERAVNKGFGPYGSNTYDISLIRAVLIANIVGFGCFILDGLFQRE